jgi:uncharacterized membrane protein YciS (DUF1049 family)
LQSAIYALIVTLGIAFIAFITYRYYANLSEYGYSRLFKGMWHGLKIGFAALFVFALLVGFFVAVRLATSRWQRILRLANAARESESQNRSRAVARDQADTCAE